MSIDTYYMWRIDRAPWCTFKDVLWADNHERRRQGVQAVIDWSGAADILVIRARFELQILDDANWAWQRDIDAREAAYHKDHPGDEWDRRAVA